MDKEDNFSANPLQSTVPPTCDQVGLPKPENVLQPWLQLRTGDILSKVSTSVRLVQHYLCSVSQYTFQ